MPKPRSKKRTVEEVEEVTTVDESGGVEATKLNSAVEEIGKTLTGYRPEPEDEKIVEESYKGYINTDRMVTYGNDEVMDDLICSILSRLDRLSKFFPVNGNADPTPFFRKLIDTCNITQDNSIKWDSYNVMKYWMELIFHITGVSLREIDSDLSEAVSRVICQMDSGNYRILGNRISQFDGKFNVPRKYMTKKFIQFLVGVLVVNITFKSRTVIFEDDRPEKNVIYVQLVAFLYVMRLFKINLQAGMSYALFIGDIASQIKHNDDVVEYIKTELTYSFREIYGYFKLLDDDPVNSIALFAPDDIKVALLSFVFGSHQFGDLDVKNLGLKTNDVIDEIEDNVNFKKNINNADYGESVDNAGSEKSMDDKNDSFDWTQSTIHNSNTRPPKKYTRPVSKTVKQTQDIVTLNCRVDSTLPLNKGGSGNDRIYAHCPVFTMANKVRHTKKSRATELVPVFSNFDRVENIGDKHISFVGVSIDNTIGHSQGISVITQGEVEMYCDVNVCTELSIGDYITWENRQIDTYIDGYTPGYQPVHIVKYKSTDALTFDTFFEDVNDCTVLKSQINKMKQHSRFAEFLYNIREYLQAYYKIQSEKGVDEHNIKNAIVILCYAYCYDMARLSDKKHLVDEYDNKSYLKSQASYLKSYPMVNKLILVTTPSENTSEQPTESLFGSIYNGYDTSKQNPPIGVVQGVYPDNAKIFVKYGDLGSYVGFKGDKLNTKNPYETPYKDIIPCQLLSRHDMYSSRKQGECGAYTSPNHSIRVTPINCVIKPDICTNEDVSDSRYWIIHAGEPIFTIKDKRGKNELVPVFSHIGKCTSQLERLEFVGLSVDSVYGGPNSINSITVYPIGHMDVFLDLEDVKDCPCGTALNIRPDLRGVIVGGDESRHIARIVPAVCNVYGRTIGVLKKHPTYNEPNALITLSPTQGLI